MILKGSISSFAVIIWLLMYESESWRKCCFLWNWEDQIQNKLLVTRTFKAESLKLPRMFISRWMRLCPSGCPPWSPWMWMISGPTLCWRVMCTTCTLSTCTWTIHASVLVFCQITFPKFFKQILREKISLNIASTKL